MGGTFENEKPIRMVAVSDFELLNHEVTNTEYFAFTKATGHSSPEHWREDWFWMSEFGTHPVVNITYYDARSLLPLSGRALAHRSRVGIRLPRGPNPGQISLG